MAESSANRYAHRRHHSVPCASSLMRSSSNFCCIGAGRRAGMRIASGYDYEDLGADAITSRSARFFTGNVRPGVRCEDDDDDVDDQEEDLYLSYKAPSRWKMFCRKLKAETRKLSRWGSSSTTTPGFHYDAASYAMNFDDGAMGLRQQQQQQEEFYGNSDNLMKLLHSSQYSGMLGSGKWGTAALSTQA